MKQLIMKKPSAMIQTNVRGLTTSQRKIINSLIFLAQKTGSQDEYSTTISKLKKLCDIRSTENVDLKKRLGELIDISIEFNYLNKDKQDVWSAMSLLAEASIIAETGEVKFAFPPTINKRIIHPALYAPLDIVLIADFKSSYSIILYEFLRDYLGAPSVPKITIQQLRDMFGLEENQYTLFYDFKRYVLKKAVKEINTKSDIKCEYDLIKEDGKKYSHILFKIKEDNEFRNKINPILGNDNFHLFFDPSTLPKEVLKVLPQEYQINAIYHLIEPYFEDLDYLVSNIEYSNKNCDKNYSAYLKLALEHDYAKVNREVKEKKDKLVRKKKDQAQEKAKREKLLKQKAWDYFNSLPETDQFKLQSDAEEKMSAALKFVKIPERRQDIINAQMEKELLLKLSQGGAL